MIRISKQADGVASTCEPQRGRTSVCVSAHDDAKLFGSAVVFILEMPVALLRGFVWVAAAANTAGSSFIGDVRSINRRILPDSEK